MKVMLPTHHDVQVCADSHSMPIKNQPIGRRKNETEKRKQKIKHRKNKNVCMRQMGWPTLIIIDVLSRFGLICV